MFRLVKLCMMMLLSVCAFGFVAPQSAFACSGGMPLTLSMLMENADTIVQGQLLQVDDSGQNAIMQVGESIKGEALPEQIFLALHNPSRINMMSERYSGGACFVSIRPLLEVGREIAIFLSYNDNGSYSLAPRHFGNRNYYPMDQTVSIQIDDSIEEMTFSEFWDAVEDLAETEAIAPITGTPYPMSAPILITTEAGDEYLFPVDASSPILLSAEDAQYLRRERTACWVSDCRAWSPHFIDNATIDDTGTIRLTFGVTVDGEAVLFSSTNDAVAIWDLQDSTTILKVYMVSYYGWSPSPPQGQDAINEISIELDDVTPNIGAWSPDGRMLAFSDDNGVWLWDVLTDGAQPERIYDTPMPIVGFSPTGRHLRLGEGADGWSIDLVNGEIYPAGVFSPNDRALATYGEQFRIIELTPYTIRNARIEGQPTEITWYDDSNQYLVTTCTDVDNRGTCFVYRETLRSVIGASFQYSGYDFDYHPQMDSVVIAQNVNTIQVASFNRWREYDLSAWLDDEIASVEWLPPLFYYD